ncbi:MAG: hypothetical protein M1292_11785 [Bacteroidetes bacterium]|nr:hypothetical protein [Bacteroidota bacterium]
MANLYVISGCNGAGKTTASYSVLPDMLNCKEFVNADEIAKGLSPFQPENVAIEAGRIMLNRIKDLISHNVEFAFETTLATKSYVKLIREAQSNHLQSNRKAMTKENVKDLRTKILKGLELAYSRLLSSKQKDDAELVISRNGKIVKVKARELTK